MTSSTLLMSTPDLQACLKESLEYFQTQRYRECLELLDRLIEVEAPINGLYFLAAVCALKLGKLDRVIPALEREHLNPQCLPEAQSLLAEIRTQYQKNPTLLEDLPSHSEYLVCGMPPHSGGTGVFLSALLPFAKEAGVRSIFPAGGFFSEAEQARIASIRDSHIVILHPQTLGYECFRSLYNAGNKISMYVLDNGFFCIQSYNHRASKRGECFDCLGDLSRCHPSCKPVPIPVSREGNLEFLSWLRSAALNIEFLCQTHHQAALLATHFGSGITCRVVGMRTDEFNGVDVVGSRRLPETERFDIVLHGHAIAAKGIRYALELATELPEYRFLIPSEAAHVRGEAPEVPISANVTMRPLSWNTGLKEAVIASNLVLCPSEWSAPVEGALLKSLEFNGSVAVLETRYGFEREIPDNLILRLPLDARRGAALVRAHMVRHSRDASEATKLWARQYRNGVDLATVFSREK